MLSYLQFDENHQAILEILTELNRMWDALLRNVSFTRHEIEIAVDVVNPVHIAWFWGGPTARKVAAAQMSAIVIGKLL